MREYLSEIVVSPSAALVGQRVFESDLATAGFRVLEVERGGEVFLPSPETQVEADDILLVQASVDQLARLTQFTGVSIKAPRVSDRELQPGAVRLAEAMVAPKSNLIGRTLGEVRFRQQFGVTALAIHRGAHLEPARVGRERLRQGDLLLIQGPRERIQTLLRDPNLWVLQTPGARSIPERRRGTIVAALFVVALGAGASGLVPLSAALLAAAVAAVLLRAITTEEAYRFIEWKLLILIGGMTAFGTAMTDSGAAALLADGVASTFGPFGPLAVLAGFAVMTVVLTQPMSNAAAALLVLPVALQAALELGVNPRTFAVTIALAASVSLATPLEPSCLIVYGPGKYRFRDFVLVGGPLTLVLLAVLLVLVPIFWPL
jgi:di/tricarboxylate transporter